MKTAKDPRHLERIKVVKEFFAWDFSKENTLETETAKQILSHLSEINSLIEQAAPNWPLEKINKMDLAILRLAVYEVVYKKDTPIKVVVDEAVEIAKEYGSESAASFVNGALGKIIQSQNLAS